MSTLHLLLYIMSHKTTNSTSPPLSLSNSSLSIPSILSYNVNSLSFYSTDPHALSRRLSISCALNDFVKTHDIICLQETNLAPRESHALSSLPGCHISRNSLSMSCAGTLIIDTPSV